jgi:DNA-directed RNA polymerase specialized sigma24 family protein
VEELAADAGRIHDRELELWQVKIEEAASQEKFVHSKAVPTTSKATETAGSKHARPLQSPAELPPKKTDLSRYLDGAGLTDHQRECASLRFEYGITLTEIAQRLGKHHSTIQYHLDRAKAKMSTKFQAKGRVKPLPGAE